MLRVGQPAPSFALASTSGAAVALEDLRGKRVVLYFYPRDDTPGCTKEACDFRDELARFRKAGVIVLGVSKDSIASHARFRAKHGFSFDLLSDPDAKTARAYGAYGKKTLYGRAFEGTIRSTFLIDEAGRVAALWSPVKVPGHVDAVLAALAGEEAPSRRARRAKSTAERATGSAARRRKPAGSTRARTRR